MFTDTDSLCYEIKTDDVYKDLFQDKEFLIIHVFITHKNNEFFFDENKKIIGKMKFDSSNYPPPKKFFFDENKKVIGKMKDEAAGMPIKEFVGLRSKMYSFHKSFSKIEELTSKK